MIRVPTADDGRSIEDISDADDIAKGDVLDAWRGSRADRRRFEKRSTESRKTLVGLLMPSIAAQLRAKCTATGSPRQRLSTAVFPYYSLMRPEAGPAGGFKYSRKRNKKGVETGGIVPHITSSTIANDEPPEETVIVDRPDREAGTVRVTGPFCDPADSSLHRPKRGHPGKLELAQNIASVRH